MQSLTLRDALAKRREETLDPDDWADVQAVAHRIVDDAVGYLRDVRDRPVWQDMPGEVRASSTTPLPRSPAPLAEVYREVAETLMPYPMGNIHPRFWAWYMGSSNFTGALGDFLAAIQGSNLGGGNHAAALMDEQVVDWCKEMSGFPASASGTLVSGGSMANIIGLDRGAQRQGGHRRARTWRRRHREAAALLWLGPDPQLPSQGDGGARARQPGAATHPDGRRSAHRPRRACGWRSRRIAPRDFSRPA